MIKYRMMTCKNCGSSDIIAIQSQNYCINCGQLVGSTGDSRGAVKLVAPTKPVSEEVSSKNIDGMGPTNSRQKEPITESLTSAKSAKKPSFERKLIADLSAPAIEDNPTAGTPKVHALQFISNLALSVALPVGGVLALALYFKVDTDLIVYGGIAASLASSLAIMLLQAALLYGGSKLRDGRLMPESQWWISAKSHFAQLLNVNLIAALGAIMIGLGAYGFWEIAQIIPDEYASLRMPILIMANMFISWLALGLFCIRRLAIAIVAIGSQPLVEAYRMAWDMYGDYGGHLILSAAETMLVRLVSLTSTAAILLGSYKLAQLSATYEPIIYGLAVVLSVLVWLVIFMRFEISIWLTRYRWIASQQSTPVKSQLLVGQPQNWHR